jgi:hypothetical protein
MTQAITQVLSIGIGAGAAAALLFASVTSGTALSLILFCLAPLPIMLVALGWSHWAGLTAAVSAAAMLGGAFGPSFFSAFLISLGGPAWWLGYLALLGRPVANGGSARMEWYPPGRLVLWTAVLGAAVTAASLAAAMGIDEPAIRHDLKYLLDVMLCPVPDTPVSGIPAVPPQIPCTSSDIDRLNEMMAPILPPMAAVVATITQATNLWLASLVVRLSGRLRRSWPDLTSLSFQPLTVVAYGVCLASALLPGLPGLFARMLAATLTVAFAMVGLAVTHAVTRGMRGRAALLLGLYGALFLLFLPAVLVMAVIGVAETLFGLRERLSRHGPPAAHNP